MAFYAAPYYTIASRVLVYTGYEPPFANSLNTTISSIGIYSYKPLSYKSITAYLVYTGYEPPFANQINVALKKNTSVLDGDNLKPIGFSSFVSGDAEVLILSRDKQYLSPQSIINNNLFGNASLNLRYQVISVDRKPSLNAMLLSYNGLFNTLAGFSCILVKYGENTRFGFTSISDRNTTVKPKGIPANKVGMYTTIANKDIVVRANGFLSSAIGTHIVVNKNQTVSPIGQVQTIIDLPAIYNLKQFVRPTTQKDQSSYGLPYLMGGVKYLSPNGIGSAVYGKVLVINTTADQYIKPTGVIAPALPVPNVSPRIIYVFGINSLSVGSSNVRDPAIKTSGALNTRYGLLTVWYHTRPLSPNSITSFSSGYAHIADPTIFVRPPSLIASAVFGDTAARNTTAFIKAISIYSSAFSDYAKLSNNRRYYQQQGIGSLSIGLTSITNNTPEIFPSAVGGSSPGIPAVGYRVRSVRASGFDRLALGSPALIKTPELNISGLDSLRTGNAIVWYRNRSVVVGSFFPSAYGRHVASFGRRYIETNRPWESHRVGSHILTHGVREMIGRGFACDSYGTVWVSQGKRTIAPTSLYQSFASNHMVGGTQGVSLSGFVATRFGTRIIPESLSIYPLGFSGVWGDSNISLYTRHLKPVGAILFDRWGRANTYNLVQNVIQNYDINSGLAPPKWTGWTAIANRNKAIGATGFNSQKYGYSKVSNNAAPLFTLGIETPVGVKTMIAHAIRSMSIDGISSPAMSNWLVVYNDARVLSVSGSNHALFGIAAAVNTRRYYRSVGRIDSLETGLPMIAYRIRNISVERRYSISPPQINLPIIDLYTRYVEFNGFETAAYGLPSLSIHLRLIAPKWIHREKPGTPALKNLTPEMGVYGHDSSEYGRGNIRTQWRNLVVQGDNSNTFGLIKISDTKQQVQVRGLQSGITSQQHTVVKTGTNPYVLQYIWLNNESDNSKDGFGISSDNEFKFNRIPRPSFNQNVLYASGRMSSKFGTAFMWSNNLFVDGGIGVPFDALPRPTVSNKNNQVSVSGINNRIEVSRGLSLSPHTIYAVKEAPAQAQANHTSRNLHYVGETSQHKPGERFGSTVVESTIRSVRPYWPYATSSVIGRPKLELKTKQVKPEPFRLSRFGVPTIPFTLQAIRLEGGIYNTDLGRAIVERPFYTGSRNIGPTNMMSMVIGRLNIENRVREVFAIGRDSLAMGSRKSGDLPFMWQGLRIGEHVPLIIGGEDTSLHGNAAVSLWVREISPQGMYEFQSEYKLESFYGRMTVANKDIPLPLVSIIDASGIVSTSSAGVTVIKYGQHFIRPDGNSEQFRKGAW